MLITVNWFSIFLVAWLRFVDQPNQGLPWLASAAYVLVAMRAAYFAVFAVLPAALYMAWSWVKAGRGEAASLDAWAVRLAFGVHRPGRGGVDSAVFAPDLGDDARLSGKSSPVGVPTRGTCSCAVARTTRISVYIPDADHDLRFILNATAFRKLRAVRLRSKGRDLASWNLVPANSRTASARRLGSLRGSRN